MDVSRRSRSARLGLGSGRRHRAVEPCSAAALGAIVMVAFLSALLPDATARAEETGVAPPGEVRIDPETGLVLDDGVGLVVAYCTVCHSTKLVGQNRATRSGWDERVRTMQTKHGMVELDPEVRAELLDYLSRHYAPIAGGGRRLPLPAPLLPPGAAEPKGESPDGR